MPSGRLVVANVPTRPLAVTGFDPAATVNGGQAWAHAPVQELCLFWSAVKRYSVAPGGSTRIVPRVALVVERMAVAEAGLPESAE